MTGPTIALPSRGLRLATGLAAAAIVAGAIGLFAVGALRPGWLETNEGSAFTPCPLKLALGLRCPLCGMIRATLRLARGDLAGAIHFHPLAPLVLAILLAALLATAWSVAAGRPLPRALRPRPAIAIALGLALWIVNLAYGHG